MDKIQFELKQSPPKWKLLRVFGILFCLIVLTAGLSGAVSAEGWGSDYDTASQFTIDNAANLTVFAKLVNEGKDFTGKTVTLSDNINLADAAWTPIGNKTYAFNGTFNGNGKKITGLNVTGEIQYAGLFGCVDYGGVVENLSVDGKVAVEITSGLEDVFTGGIAGWNYGTISECSSNVSVTATGGGTVYAGGIAGKNIGLSGVATIENCFSTGSVIGTFVLPSGIDNVSGVCVYAGGVVGQNFASIDNVLVENCYATGSVEGKAENENVEVYVSGVVGQNFNESYKGQERTATIKNCYALNEKVYAFGSGVLYASDFTNSTSIETISGYSWNMMPVETSNPDVPIEVSNSYVTVDDIWNNSSFNFGNANVWKTGTSENFMLPVLISLGEPNGADASHLIPVHNISFAGNYEGSVGTAGGSMEDLPVKYGTTVNLPANVFTNEGYAFNGWNTAEDMSGTYYADGAQISFADVLADDFRLYAEWSFDYENYSIIYLDGGWDSELPEHELYVKTGEIPTKPQNPALAGYIFSGWTHDGVSYNFDAAVTEDIVLEANWAPITYTVKFNNDNSASDKTQEHTYDVLSTLTKFADSGLTATDGKYFAGWAYESGGQAVYADGATVKNLASENGTEVNLYAVWSENEPVVYKVVFSTGKNHSPYLSIMEYVLPGGMVTEPPEPTIPGYSFNFWQNGTEIWVFSSDGVTQNTILTANWTANTYVVIFDENGGDFENQITQEFTYDVPQKLTKNTYIAPSGKVFAGWNTKADGSGTSYADEAEVKNLVEDGCIDLFAQWKDVPSGGSSSSGGSSKPSKPAKPERPEEPSEPGIITPSETVIEETKEIVVSEETTEVLENGETVIVVEFENTEAVQAVAVPEEIAKENPEASVKITEGNKETVLLPGDVTTEEVHIIVDLSVVDKQGNPVEIKSSGYFIIDADVHACKKLVVGHYKNGIWEDCKVENVGNGHYKVYYNGLSPFAAVFVEENEDTPFVVVSEDSNNQPETPDTAESPIPILAVFAGLGCAVLLRRK